MIESEQVLAGNIYGHGRNEEHRRTHGGPSAEETRNPHEINLTLRLGSPNLDDLSHILSLSLPHTNLDIVKTLRKGQQLRVRGIIDDFFALMIKLNYADLEIAAE
jgi:hypothetical protein